MKKIIICLIILLLMSGCKKSNTNETNLNKYNDLASLLEEHIGFESSSEFFDVSFDIVKISEGYRYYVTIDNARIAMYDIEAIVIEKGENYLENMAGTIGIFENENYSIIPNQSNASQGFVKGINISAITYHPSSHYYLLVQWHNKDHSIISREYLEFDINYGENNAG